MTSETATTSRSQFYGLSGLALMGGAAASIVYVMARSLLTAGVDPATSARAVLWVPSNVLGFLGAALVLLGLPGLYAKIAVRTGWQGLAGVVLIALAWMFFGLFLSLYGALVEPWLADKVPVLIAASAPLPVAFIVTVILALVAWLLGTVLLAIPFVQGDCQPRWVGYLLPASPALAVLGDVIVPGGPASNLAINLLSNLGPIVFVLGLAGLGFHMWSEHALIEQNRVAPRSLLG